MAQKPSIPKGTRDFSPQEMVRRNYIFDTIKQVFQRYGYLPIETPAMENLDTLMGKYGEEGDKLIFKILESGEYTASLNENIISKFNEIVREDDTTKKFIAIAEDFARQISDTIPNLINETPIYIERYYLSNLSATEFLKYQFRPDYWFNIKKVFVDYLMGSRLLLSDRKERRYVKYLRIGNPQERQNEIFSDFCRVVKGSPKLRSIIRIESFSKEYLQPSNLNKTISKKALKYDLTVPFARYVVQHQSEITFPFKRYQIQPVWRADRPQKGRYREFYQCDADVIGSNSLINEVELVQMIDDVFDRLKVPVLIKINNRKILQGLGIAIGEEDRIVDITVALDKYDKIGQEIYKELADKGFSQDKISKLKTFTDEFTALKEGNDRINYLKKMFKDIPIGMTGLTEFEFIFNSLGKICLNLNMKAPNVELDLTLARGLNYYTGTIFEVKANVGTLTSSICGGGRYDDLTGIFGLPNMSGVGISFGADRIYDVLNELNLYPDTVSASTKLLFVAFNDKDQSDMLPMLAKVRKAGINSEIYPNTKADAKKQFTYGESKNIPFVVSTKDGVLTLKNIVSGEREELTIEKIIEKLK